MSAGGLSVVRFLTVFFCFFFVFFFQAEDGIRDTSVTGVQTCALPISPKSQGGKDAYGNLQLLHRHCHDKKTSTDDKTCTHDKGSLREERSEAKVS